MSEFGAFLSFVYVMFFIIAICSVIGGEIIGAKKAAKMPYRLSQVNPARQPVDPSGSSLPRGNDCERIRRLCKTLGGSEHPPTE
jgi:hypothetical protein